LADGFSLRAFIINVVNVVIAFVAKLFIAIAAANGHRSNPFAAYVAFDFLIHISPQISGLLPKRKADYAASVSFFVCNT
ncbi:hypothetical protein AUN04_20725, partial [Cronobacter sakazakii]